MENGNFFKKYAQLGTIQIIMQNSRKFAFLNFLTVCIKNECRVKICKNQLNTLKYNKIQISLDNGLLYNTYLFKL